MGGIDKLGEDICGRSVLQRAAESMVAASSVRDVILVASPERAAAAASLQWVMSMGARVIPGGPRRQDSVAAGVRVAEGDVVLVHDGARPFVAPDVVDAVAAAALEHGAAIPVLPVVDSLKQVAGGLIAGTAPREGLFRAQTPQGARRDLLRDAVDALAGTTETFGDEAELLARHGVAVRAVAGDPGNLKLTVPADLQLARAMVEGEGIVTLAGAGGVPARWGLGEDSHPFGPAVGLRLGGIEVAGAPRLAGHSDGDVALHAVCDALLGAAGLPDLGRAFPAGDPGTRGIESSRLLHAVVAQVAAAGWRPMSVDVTVIGARPRLGGRRLDAMRDAIASLVGLPADRVAVKASTGNLSGDEGAGRGMRATAIVGVIHR